MNNQIIIAAFHSIADAERARDDLRAAGLPASDVQIGSADVPRPAALTPGPEDATPREEGFWSWLFGSEATSREAQRYQAHVYEAGQPLLSVRASAALDEERIREILEQHNPIELEDGSEFATAERVTSATGVPPSTGTGMSGTEMSGTEEVIPTAEEELQVGKREISGTTRYRVRSYTISRPVEEQVALRDEKVVIERRTPSYPDGSGEAAFQEKEVEVTERHEEPVVSKVVHPGEDVVIRKDAKDRVETVRDTVRETKVEVDRAAAGDKPSAATERSALPDSDAPAGTTPVKSAKPRP